MANHRMSEMAREHCRLAFMAVVTTTLLAMAFAESSRGLIGLTTAAVHAFAAAFGLEFVGAVWAARHRHEGRSAHPG